MKKLIRKVSVFVATFVVAALVSIGTAAVLNYTIMPDDWRTVFIALFAGLAVIVYGYYQIEGSDD